MCVCLCVAAVRVCHACACPQDGGVELNAVKAEIDSLTEQLEVKKAAAGSSGSTGGEPGVLDDEHYQLLGQLKAAKARWVLGVPVAAGRPWCSASSSSSSCSDSSRQSAIVFGVLDPTRTPLPVSGTIPQALTLHPCGVPVAAGRPRCREPWADQPGRCCTCAC